MLYLIHQEKGITKMITPASREEMNKELAELLKDIDKVVEDNRAALADMAENLFTMFNPQRSQYGNSEIYYILRQTIYQKYGYSRIERDLKENLWDKFLAANPNAVVKTSQAIRSATGLIMPEKAVKRAVELRVKENVDHYSIRDKIKTHVDRLLDQVIWGR